jgi:membrane associated rhomboid family serine protease
MWGILPEETLETLVLNGWSFPGLVGHVLLHAGLDHLIGNMIFLWVFGNAICTNTSNWLYLPVFLACTLIAAAVHVLADGSPAIGASGAMNGIVGIVLAMYPLNRVNVFWLFLVRGGSFSCLPGSSSCSGSLSMSGASFQAGITSPTGRTSAASSAVWGSDCCACTSGGSSSRNSTTARCCRFSRARNKTRLRRASFRASA